MNDDERQIREVVQRWMDATRAGDIEAVLELMTCDVVFLRPGCPPMIGRAAFAQAAGAASTGPRPTFEGTSEIREIRVLGEWAYLRTELSIVATFPGRAPLAQAGTTLSILCKQDGRWRIARDANMLAPV